MRFAVTNRDQIEEEQEEKEACTEQTSHIKIKAVIMKRTREQKKWKKKKGCLKKTLRNEMVKEEPFQNQYKYSLGVGGIDKYHTTVFKMKILRYN